jgi:hypothetical protein
MPNYCVNKRAQLNGDHEVHQYSCSRLPDAENRLFLGDFPSCTAAVRKAKETYPQSNGCFYCSEACHTG